MAVSGNSRSPEGRRRLLTALFLLPGLGLIWYGGPPAAALVLLAGVVMLYEALGVAGVGRGSPRGVAVFALGLGPALSGLVLPFAPAPQHIHWVGMAGCALGLLALGRSRSMSALLVAVMLALAGGVGLALREGGVPWLVLVVVVIAAADVAAYFAGKRLGGPRLAPSISPSKTWSGAIAGLAGGSLAAAVLGGLFSLPAFPMAIAGLVIADLSIGGDLLESMFKRAFGVKDAGSILPGHGGLLDRFDGYLLALPAAYLAVGLGWMQGVPYG